eukprot:CAMPEP_0119134712 /NCGR_PEP_ID=MMETSP1310-20130426/17637_1 /TAXON_ID=464262 /ORGANISM="Genus nov. species nov., Strain RCC2339" /LENGTH=217 /DNA_ID=CAMNT_0007125537 /DNA_START=27 /DNA_END=676 /DNA_ORIENTATION=+
MEDLALTNITLYKRDMGFFQHKTIVKPGRDGEAQFRLRVPKTHQKTVFSTVRVRGPGSISTTFGRKRQDLAKKQQRGQYNFSLDGSFAKFLSDSKGYHYRFSYDDRADPVEGCLVMMEREMIPEGDKLREEQYLVFLTGTVLERFHLKKMRRLEILDEVMAQKLASFLALRSQDIVPEPEEDDTADIIIKVSNLDGSETIPDSARELEVSYICPLNS